MDRIGKLAAHSVLRGAGFAGLAVMLTIAGLLFDPPLALKVGGAGFLVVAVAMDIKASIYPHKRRIRESEVWIMLADHERPSESAARPLIVAAMQRELREKALWFAGAAAGCFVLSIVAPATLGG